MHPLQVVSTSRSSAICSDIIIRESDTVRLLFRPEIVANPGDPAACLRGTFLYQRKGKSDEWLNSPIDSLAHLKKGEGYKLELPSGELVSLLRELARLYKLAREDGVPQGRQQYVKLERNLAQLLDLGDAELHAFLSTHPTEAVATLRKVLRWLTDTSALGDFIEADGGQIAAINAALGLAALRTVHAIWRKNTNNESEEFWQRQFSEHTHVFSQLFAYPVVVLREKAYVGGKRLDNQHGNIADYLAKSAAVGNALIIEIKTPGTPLLGSAYRDEAFPLSSELTGAVAQVLKYRDSLFANMRALDDEAHGLLLTEPRCLIVAGHCGTLDCQAKKLSFERFRERINGVTLVTFDELFRRVEQFEELLGPPV
ncbi:MAG: hypothetical protein JWM41_1566 [Gemmatimonadetes bacterium]|nr:hypothetical protein [Gemmatimonadota bacterium]